MDMKFVQSSNIIAMGYDEIDNTMGVQFKGGKVYHYAGVPKDLFEQVRDDPVSVGSAFNELIRHDYDGIPQ